MSKAASGGASSGRAGPSVDVVSPARPTSKQPAPAAATIPPPVLLSPSSAALLARGDFVAPSPALRVFLGGACGETTWRAEEAIPLLTKAGVTFYDPQVKEWSPNLVALEGLMKAWCPILLFVIGRQTRALASMIEVASLMSSAQPRRTVVLVIEPVAAGVAIEGAVPSASELKDLNRARAYLKDVAETYGVPVHADVAAGIQAIIDMERENKTKEEQEREQEQQQREEQQNGSSSNGSGSTLRQRSLLPPTMKPLQSAPSASPLPQLASSPISPLEVTFPAAAGSTYAVRPPSLLDTVLVLLLLSVPLAISVLGVNDKRTAGQLALTTLLSVGAYAAVSRLIPFIQHYTMKRNLSGKDLNKPGRKEDKPDVPESQGVVSGVVFVIALIFMQLQYATDNRLALVEWNAALHSIGFMIFLGFVDDVVDLPWRYKLILPTIASLPLVVAYAGSTYVAVPWPLVALVGSSVNLGILYQVYMLLLSVFCTNAINIYAGVNGLEAGQSLVIGVSILCHNLVELALPGSAAFHANHMFSAALIVPFLGCTLGLLRWNWYPSSVFVGDCFCYFAGMTFAVSGILGHFSKTLMLFFAPQLINFVYSLPQILGLFGLTCPRHRLPRYNAATDKLEAVPQHHNLLNLALMVLGPQHERTLCRKLLVFQAACSLAAFAVRYWLASYFFPQQQQHAHVA